MTIYDVINIMTGLCESCIAFMLFNNFMERRPGFKRYIYWLGVIAVTIGINISNYFLGYSRLNVLCIIVIMTLASWLYKSDLKTRPILGIISVAISGGAEVIILMMLSAFKGVTRTDIYLNPGLRVLGIVLSKGLGLAITNILCIIKGRKLYKIQTRYWIFFTTIYVVVLSTIYLMFMPPPDDSISFMTVICSIGLFCSVFMVLYLYENMSKQALQLKEKELLEQQYEFQVKHLDELMFAYDQVRGVKHDLKNHMGLLKAYLVGDNCKAGIEYIDKLMERIDIQSMVVDTGNSVIDAVINAKRNLAKEKNIAFYDDIKIPKNMKLDPSDCCVIFGNALDNAIEACEKLSGDKYIKVSLIYNGSDLSCKITNSAPEKKKALLETTKKNKEEHGLGIVNIKNTLNKYDSIYQFEQEDREFIFSFVIKGIS